MNAIPFALASATALAAAGTLAGALVPARQRPLAVGACTAALGVAAMTAGGSALTGGSYTAWLPGLLPLAGVRLGVDALSGLFMTVTGAVVLAAAVYGVGYASPERSPEPSPVTSPEAAPQAAAETSSQPAQENAPRPAPQGGHGAHGVRSRGVQAVLPLFALALVLVPAAASVSTLLVLWELMAVSSLLLVLAEHLERPSVRDAGVWYAVMTHLGFVLLLLGLALFAARAGGESFAQLRAGAGGMSAAVRGTVFVTTAAAFTSKAGLAPLHAWLPRAHPEAPSHVSALMSAAMVNLGVYGVLRVGFDLLGGGPAWWWLLLMAMGALSAVYGILQAAMAADLKRLLAYSTSENMGLVMVGAGAAGLFRQAGDRPLAALALAAALLHVVNHAAFKALLFCAAGSVLRATGLRDLDRLGGLRAGMPVTAGLFALGALGAVALPPGNGFISEWLLLQALVHGLAVPGAAAAVVLPVAVAVVALSAGLAAAVFVKALGVGFFARPRSAQAGRAAESPPAMLAGMGLLAVCCAGLALVPGVLGDPLARAVGAAGVTGTPLADTDLDLRLRHTSAALHPLWVALALVTGVLVAAGLARLPARRRRRRDARLWDCGGGAPTPRMAYTATSFAEPLQRVFDDVLAPEQDVDVTPVRESGYLVERVRFQRLVPDRIEHRLYRPLLAALARTADRARALGGGSVHLYLGYGLFGLVAVLAALVVGW